MSSRSGQKPKTHRPLTTTPKIINSNRTAPEGKSHMRDKATIKRLAMYNTRAKFNREGQFMGGAFMNKTVDEPVKRIAPDRRWFGNTRVVGQKDLNTFREQMANKVNDPYTVILRQQKLPMALLNDPFQNARMDLLQVETFEDTFGPKSQRKKARLPENIADLGTLLQTADQQGEGYIPEKDNSNNAWERDFLKDDPLQKVFKKGQSKRIWNELYKVIDSSDVVVQVLDVRDPMGTRCKRIEDELRKTDRRHKHMVLVLNKCDLVPTWVTRRWIKILSREYPTLAFHASITNPFGKGSLLQLLRQFGRLHADKKQISVGFVGYPNVGKSSVINAVKGENVCNAAPVPGETKCWKYITLFKRIFLIDCPGVVYPFGNTPTDCVLKGVVRVETIKDPTDYVAPILNRMRPQYVVQHFGVASWTDSMDFLDQLARKSGKLLKGGDPDVNIAARMVLHDWQLGRLPYFVCPPFDDLGDNLFDMSKIGASSHNVEHRNKQLAGELDEEAAEGEEATESVVTPTEEDEEDLEFEENIEEEAENAHNAGGDDGLNTESDESEDEGVRSMKTKVNKLRKKQKIADSIRLEVEEQDIRGIALKQNYSAIDTDETLYWREQLNSESKINSARVHIPDGASTTSHVHNLLESAKNEKNTILQQAENLNADVNDYIASSALFAGNEVPAAVKSLFDLTPLPMKKNKREREIEEEMKLTGKSFLKIDQAQSVTNAGHKKAKRR